MKPHTVPLFLFISLSFACGSVSEPAPDGCPQDARSQDAGMVAIDAEIPDATSPDAMLTACIYEHRYFVGNTFDPPYAVAGPVGRLVYNEYGAIGVDDGFIDSGETITLTWDRSVVLLEYRVTWREDGPDADRFPGAHNYVVSDETGVIAEGRSGILDDLTEIGRRAVSLSVSSVDGDRSAFQYVQYCVPSDRCECEIPPDAGF